jgi:hypothetical protein
VSRAPAWCLVLAVACVTARADCPPGNLLELEGVRATPAAGQSVLAGRFLPDGSAGGVELSEPLVLDLGVERSLRALLIQADAATPIHVEASLDARRWTPLGQLAALEGPGLRSRTMRSSAAARFLRLSPGGTARPWHVSALAAWCRLPERPAAALARREAARRVVEAARGVLAASGLILLGVAAWRPPRSPRAQRIFAAALGTLGIAALGAWWNFGFFHFGEYVHRWEQFHYFLGGKYFSELGYTRLYECVTLADAEDVPARPLGERRLRDPRSNEIVGAAAVLGDPGACRGRFTAERWSSFKADVAWFRTTVDPERWERLFLDHGYNAPPVWAVAGTALTYRLPANRVTVMALALLDPVLLLAMWALVVRAFGWRSACVAALWWGTNRLSDFGWTGGGLLRQDWLALAVGGVALVRLGRSFAGGFALAWAALARVFPALLLACLALGVLARSVAARRFVLDREHRRIAAGCVAAIAILVPLSLATAGGIEAWSGFVEDARASVRSTGGNIVGLMAALSWSPEGRLAAMRDATAEDPEARWLAAKRETHARRLFLQRGIAVAFAVLLALAVRREPAWAALALGAGLVPVAAFVASYYCSILLLLGLLASRRGPYVGAVLCGLSLATHAAARAWPAPIEMETRFACASLATVIAVVLVTIRFLRPVASHEGQGW